MRSLMRTCFRHDSRVSLVMNHNRLLHVNIIMRFNDWMDLASGGVNVKYSEKFDRCVGNS